MTDVSHDVTNRSLLAWVDEVSALCQPDRVHWCDGSEEEYARLCEQMVESGNWLIPHRGSELYSDKPPAFMALQAASFEVTRNWRIAFLLPSLLFSVVGLRIWVLVLFRLFPGIRRLSRTSRIRRTRVRIRV